MTADAPLAMPASESMHQHRLHARRMGITTTQHEPVVFMREDCFLCRSEGLTSRPEILVVADGREIVASVFRTSGDVLAEDEIGMSKAAWDRLGVEAGQLVAVRHSPPAGSLSALRSRVYGNRLDDAAFHAIITDIVAGRYNDVHLSSFVTACSALPLDHTEMAGLTRAMVDAGDRLAWGDGPIVDKHSVGGLPGNRTTPIIVAIVAANGLVMPKTSSRAITSPAGTADTMETLAPVDLNLAAIRRVVEQEGGCIAWGGSVRLSPADDTIIGIERVLDLDAVGQMVASILSKKVAAGSTHLVIDLPVGPTAKVRTAQAAATLSDALVSVGNAFGLQTRVLEGSGLQPIGRGIGPALEARDVLAVLQQQDGPQDLGERAVQLAGAILELGGRSAAGQGEALARETLVEGRAWAKFQRICEAQGGMRVPPVAAWRHTLVAPHAGRLSALDNRRLAKLAKLAGAPAAPAAGVEMHARLGDQLEAGAPLCTVHAESRSELSYALDYVAAGGAIFALGQQ
ncbi:thymidine phosphorylase family protein [Sphingopyxis sp. GW247-27LB]|uniref:thymidine phosphorylase family protein n=1 Tax=Sphingopyxis sp. GW247-27LB TaxID=2012632 RepID=UPI000BA5AE21|nr:thymidine phosphorylase family protein [Sphingopyxis sp. GW247-27LB]PAL19770.1 thymidine phosphorylase [Sphingopyxis sp. GW247-27LB]